MLEKSQNHPATPLHLGGGFNSNSSENEINLLYMAKLIFRRPKLILAGAGVGCALALIFALTSQDSYKATTTLEIRPMRENAAPDPVYGNVISEGAVTVQSLEDIATTAEKVKSFEFLNRVAKMPEIQSLFDIEKGKDDSINKRVKQLSSWIEVAHITETRLLRITATHKTPEKAAQLANALANVIIQVGVASRSEVANQVIKDLEQDFIDLNLRVLNAQQRLSLYSGSADIREALAKARQEVKALSSRYKIKHPAMADAMNVVAQLETSLVAELDSIRKNQVEDAYWASFTVSETSFKGQGVSTVEYLIASRFAFLTSELEGLSELYNDLNKTLSGIRIANNSDDLDLKIFEPAYPPDADDTANVSKSILLGAGMIVGGGLGAMAALLLGLLGRNVRNAEEWQEKISLPLLGEVMSSNTLLTYPNDIACQQIRFIRSQLSSGAGQFGKQSILVTSAMSGEGKTALAISIARSFAQIQSKVVLIDLNLHSPAIYQTLQLDGSLGIAEVIAGKRKLAEVTYDSDCLSVIPAGLCYREAVDFLTPAFLRELLAGLSDVYDLIIIDGPPALCFPEARVLTGLTSSTVLVANAQSTPFSDITRATEVLLSAGGRVEGVLNNVLEQDLSQARYYPSVDGSRSPAGLAI